MAIGQVFERQTQPIEITQDLNLFPRKERQLWYDGHASESLPR